jgi:glutamine---fructose-6-phosphate transaminase (isomerizing)
VQLSDFDGRPITREVQHITWDPIMAEKGGFKHFMLKEIYEQPRAVRDTTLGRVSLDTGKVFLDEMDITEDEFRKRSKGQHRRLRHQLARRAGRQVHDRAPGQAAGGSRLRQRVRYRDPLVGPDTICAADHAVGRDGGHHRRAARVAKAKGAKTLAICNVVGSMITREANGHHLHPRRAGDRRGLDQGLSPRS